MTGKMNRDEWLAGLEKELAQVLEVRNAMAGKFFVRMVFEQMAQRGDTDCLACCRWLEDNCGRMAVRAAMIMELLSSAEAAIQKAWKGRRFRRAEALAKLMAACGDAEWLAFLIRRGEVADRGAWSLPHLLKLLKPGVTRLSAMSIANTALALMMLSGNDEDWREADELFARMPMEQADAVFDRWLPLLLREELEAVLVMFMLQRHDLCGRASLPDMPLMHWYLQTQMPRMPQWLRDDWAPTLEDIMACNSSLSMSLEQAYVDNAPRTRAMAEELLDAIDQYDDIFLYEALLDEFSFAPLLTDAELQRVRDDFYRLFDVPEERDGE